MMFLAFKKAPLFENYDDQLSENYLKEASIHSLSNMDVGSEVW